VSLAEPMRGHGFARELIGQGVELLRKKDRVVKVHAFVKPGSPKVLMEASLRTPHPCSQRLGARNRHRSGIRISCRN
jgi:hypothetical protein